MSSFEINLQRAVIVALSRREQEILLLLGKGFRNANIAAELGVSQSTVRSHVASLATKLRAEGSRQIVSRVLEEGVLIFRPAA